MERQGLTMGQERPEKALLGLAPPTFPTVPSLPISVDHGARFRPAGWRLKAWLLGF